MNLTLKAGAFAAAAKLAGSAIPAKSTLPVLKNLLIDANGNGRVRFAATDLDHSVEAFADAEIAEPGAITLKEETVSALVSGLANDADLTLTRTGDRARITSGRSNYRLPLLPAEDYPSLPVPDADATTLKMPLGELLDAIAKIAPFASEDTTRPILCAVLVQVTGEGLNLIATDTHRLAVLTLDQSGPEADYLIPAKVLNRIRTFSGADDEETEIVLSQHQAVIATANWRLTTRLAEGKHVPWRRLLPEAGGTCWSLETEEFAAALRRVRVVAKDQVQAERLMLIAGGSTLQIRALGAETGDGVEDVSCEIDGEELEGVGFNARYLLDICAAIGPKLRIYLTDPLKPALVLGPGENHKIVLMPMHLK